ncbi:bifunctional folylpolyglutamate synthase/dihydrofolate synthase [Alkalihalobacillus sp. LMS6]|uniref:bifunctional folylpolyglutamate synthase/dihydrofolate synthase n=1 Tax=Bacillaceae TaxID=186817 RepID=UPI000C08419D|nr:MULTISPECIES: folylpolyglutamate synthase/dihydrofolate synthase family protein [Bacillaceae]UTR05099.1 bifunctional folylpolyglutamate synthase/dihydrofolate synthase [Alkalihalobacillus sp. LMS6]
MKTSKEAIEWIHSLLPFGIKPGLKRMEWMLEQLNNPHKKLKAVHIGGTNGKGSTVSFLQHMLMEKGWQVGTFTSPYIERFEERISINGEPISEKDLVWGANQVRPLVEELAETELGSPTEFEVITTIMFVYFATRKQPDLCLIEVGLGGRFDSTNVLEPLVSIITMIGHDHMHILGDTLEDIAYEKAGIIKKSTPVIIGDVKGEPKQVIANQAATQDAAVYLLNEDFSYETVKSDQFSYHGTTFGSYRLSMLGTHQHHNATLALKAIEILDDVCEMSTSPEEKAKGLLRTTWPGRLEWLSNQPALIVDGAHNQEGFLALADTIQHQFHEKRISLFIGVTEGKDVTPLVKQLKELMVTYYCCSFSFFRAAPAQQLYDQIEHTTEKLLVENWKQALKDRYETATEDELIIITGSLYFIADVRQFVQRLNN